MHFKVSMRDDQHVYYVEAPTWYLARYASFCEWGSRVLDVVLIPDLSPELVPHAFHIRVDRPETPKVGA